MSLGTLARGHSLNLLGRGPLADAINQISRLYALWFHTGRFFYVFPIQANVKYVTPGVRPFLAPGA